MKPLRPVLSYLPALLLLAPGLVAQGRVGAGVASGPRVSNAFAAATLGNGITGVFQVGMVPHPNGTPGLFLGGMTVQGLSAGLGGAGGFDVVAFTYDRTTDAVTLNNSAAALNTANNEFALNWGRNGLYAVVDRTGGVFQATTATPGGVLAAPTAVAGLTGQFIDPCPARLGGADVLFFDHPSGIAYVAHNVAGSAVTGSAVVVATPSVTGNICHSAAPLHGADGDVQGLIACEADATFAASDWNWQSDLNPATPPVTMEPTATLFDNNGTEAGGRVYMAQSSGANSQIIEWDIAAVLGDTVPAAGGLATLTGITAIKAAGQPDATVLVNGFPGYLAGPFAVPGIGNLFGLDTLFITIPGVMVHVPNTGRASIAFNMPAFPSGTDITLQGLTLFSLGTGPSFFTNTFAIHVQ